jgi:hypothetical protein
MNPGRQIDFPSFEKEISEGSWDGADTYSVNDKLRAHSSFGGLQSTTQDGILKSLVLGSFRDRFMSHGIA